MNLRVAAAVAALVVFSHEAGAGASLRSEGEQLYSVSANSNWATERWDDHGDESAVDCDGDPATTGEKNTYESLSLYGEYGLSYYHTLLAGLGVGKGKCGADSETGLTDLRLGVRGRLNRYLNSEGWELGVTVPLSGEPVGRSRVGCGAVGAWGGVDFKKELVEDRLSVGYGGQVHLWERPLAHEGRVDVDLSGHVVQHLTWQAGVRHQFPLTEVEGASEQSNVVDCGTNAQATKLSADLRYNLTRDSSFGCGYTHAVWGENTSISRSVSCAYTYIVR